MISVLGNLGYGKLGVGSSHGVFGKMQGVGSSHGGFDPEGELFVPLEGTPRFPVTETDPGDLDASLIDGKARGGGGGGGVEERPFREASRGI